MDNYTKRKNIFLNYSNLNIMENSGGSVCYDLPRYSI